MSPIGTGWLGKTSLNNKIEEGFNLLKDKEPINIRYDLQHYLIR